MHLFHPVDHTTTSATTLASDISTLRTTTMPERETTTSKGNEGFNIIIHVRQFTFIHLLRQY